MKFFDMLGEFFTQPTEFITQTLDDMSVNIATWWAGIMHSASVGFTTFMIQGVAICVISYGAYCAGRIMCTTKDENFSEYINKSMIAGLAYFFVKCGGTLILKFLG